MTTLVTAVGTLMFAVWSAVGLWFLWHVTLGQWLDDRRARLLRDEWRKQLTRKPQP